MSAAEGSAESRPGSEFGFSEVFLASFAPCFLVATATLLVLLVWLVEAEGGQTRFPLPALALIAATNAGLCGGTVLFLGLSLKRALAVLARPGALRNLTGVGVVAGLAAPFVLKLWGAVIAGTVIVLLVARHVTRFFVSLRVMLAPDYRLTWVSLGRLILTYGNLMAAFSIINLNLAIGAGFLAEGEPAFAFSTGPDILVDVLYFSVVLMTTVGFGDIAPLTPLAKAVVAVECLLSYVMFALAIGLVVRGIEETA